jgi:small-conductance mechanosensitive channel
VNSKALSETAVTILARCTTKASDFESTLFDLNRAIKERLEQEGIALPVQRPVMFAPVTAKQA